MHPTGPTPRTRLKRRPQRGSYDRAVVHAILDEGLVAHVGFVAGEHPVVLPMAYGRDGDVLYLHGARANGMLGVLSARGSFCVTVTLVDGLVFARSAFHHSMNYRSVVVVGTGRPVTDHAEKLRASEVLMRHVLPGGAYGVRAPNDEELAQTSFVAIPIEEASAKVRSGPPIDAEEDYALDVWAGVVPLRLAAGAPEDDPRLREGIAAPPEVATYRRELFAQALSASRVEKTR